MDNDNDDERERKDSMRVDDKATIVKSDELLCDISAHKRQRAYKLMIDYYNAHHTRLKHVCGYC
jgi:hypothetical protein